MRGWSLDPISATAFFFLFYMQPNYCTCSSFNIAQSACRLLDIPSIASRTNDLETLRRFFYYRFLPKHIWKTFYIFFFKFFPRTGLKSFLYLNFFSNIKLEIFVNEIQSSSYSKKKINLKKKNNHRMIKYLI